MGRTHLRVRISGKGHLEVVDPGFDTLPLLQEIDPDYVVKSAPLPAFSRPRFQVARQIHLPVTPSEARQLSEEELWTIHDAAFEGGCRSCAARRGISWLALKVLLANRILASCRLCGRRCGVDRTQGRAGPCGLGRDAYVAEHFVHIAEEPPINPSLVLNLRACALRCRYCQQSTLLDPRRRNSELLTGSLWSRLDHTGARSISFVGGNPDESMTAILKFLTAAPHNWALPVVWNTHALMSEEGLRLLDGVVDCYLPDFKCFAAQCSENLSGMAAYPSIARAALKRLLAGSVPVVVRILVLPGHNQCCHLPALRWLAEHRRGSSLLASISGQYTPDWRVKPGEALGRRATTAEVAEVRDAAWALGIAFVDSDMPILRDGETE